MNTGTVQAIVTAVTPTASDAKPAAKASGDAKHEVAHQAPAQQPVVKRRPLRPAPARGVEETMAAVAKQIESYLRSIRPRTRVQRRRFDRPHGRHCARLGTARHPPDSERGSAAPCRAVPGGADRHDRSGSLVKERFGHIQSAGHRLRARHQLASSTKLVAAERAPADDPHHARESRRRCRSPRSRASRARFRHSRPARPPQDGYRASRPLRDHGERRRYPTPPPLSGTAGPAATTSK